MGSTGRWFTLTVIVVAAALGTLFTLQNVERVTHLSLDVWVTAFQLKSPQPVPYLLWVAFGSGLLLAGTLGSIQRLGQQRRIRELEQDLARASLRSADDDWS